MTTLGDHLRQKRLGLGLLQREVAARLGVDEATVSNGERNATHPALPLMPEIIRSLGYSPHVQAGSRVGRQAQYRETRGLSIKQLAGALGVDPSTEDVHGQPGAQVGFVESGERAAAQSPRQPPRSGRHTWDERSVFRLLGLEHV
ncbi:MAG: helix-turn-helix domain-containing protein [Acidobacteria bacterium]|nr:helix-turn-helix domain-containing protein [Acidobacteriota bacterium]